MFDFIRRYRFKQKHKVRRITNSGEAFLTKLYILFGIIFIALFIYLVFYK